MFSLPFSNYLFRIFSLLAVAFFASGAISWVAANWSFFDKIAKLGLLEISFGLSLVIGLCIYYRELKKASSHFQSQLWLFLAAVLIGGLFALIGQIYQTGANAWQLFAIWTLLQIPLIYALPNIVNVLLCLVTFNTALVTALLLQGETIIELSWVAAVNLILLFIVDRFSYEFNDNKFILAHLLFAWLLALFIIGGIIEPHSHLIFLALAASLVWHFRRHYGFLRLGFIYAIVVCNILIIDNKIDDSFITLLLLFNFMAIILTIFLLHKSYNIASKIMLIFVSLIFTLSFLVFCFVILGIASELFFLILAVSLFISTFFIKQQVLRDVLVVLSVLAGIIYTVWILSLRETIYSIALWGLSGLYAFGYYREKPIWLKVVLVLGILFIFFASSMPYLLGIYYFQEEIPFWVSHLYTTLPLFCLFAFILYAQGKHQFYAFGWGILLSCLIMEGIQAVNFNAFSANAETELRSLTDFLHSITLNFFQAEEFGLIWWLSLLSAFLPVWGVIWLIYQAKVKGIAAVVLLIAAILLSLGFIASSIVGICFSLLLIAYFVRSRILWAVCMIGLLIFLTLFYYNLTISLLFKSLLLMGTGAILGVLALFLYTRQENAQVYNRQMSKRVRLGGLVCFIATLGIANFSIWQFEDILENGEKIVLKLAPRDPRSLMQGDYMILNYAILNELNELKIEALDDVEKQYIFYLKLNNENGVDQLCGYSLSSPPMEFSPCRENIYLPIKVQRHQIKMAGMDFFFPEGQRAYFEQAEYGEFRFKNGKLLLLRLLDKGQNPL